MEIKGQIKYIDKMGRLVIPTGMRKLYNMSDKTPVEVCLTAEGILIKPLEFEVVRKKYL